MRRWPTSETQLGPPVIAWLCAAGWDVYQEVTSRAGRADIVATLGRLVCVVELKCSLGLDVIVQADAWRPWAHFVWIAGPKLSRFHSQPVRRLLRDVCEWKGIGVIEVRKRDQYVESETIEEVVAPSLNRRASAPEIVKDLFVAQKTALAAGSTAGGHWTAFRETGQRLRNYVADRGGRVLLKTAIAEVNHHYASAASARAHLVEWIAIGKVDGLRIERIGRDVYVATKESQ